MPYTEQKDRDPMMPFLEKAAEFINTPGDLTYAITYLMHLRAIELMKTAAGNYKQSYSTLSRVRASANDASDEFYRVVMGRYEDRKRMENGSVSILDALTLEEIR